MIADVASSALKSLTGGNAAPAVSSAGDQLNYGDPLAQLFGGAKLGSVEADFNDSDSWKVLSVIAVSVLGGLWLLRH